MIEALWVMTYFKISLPTRNWDIAFLIGQFPLDARIIQVQAFGQPRELLVTGSGINDGKFEGRTATVQYEDQFAAHS